MKTFTYFLIVRSVIVIIIGLIPCIINAQRLNIGFGLEVNRMDLSTKAPEVTVPYKIWYAPSFGLAGVTSFEFEITDYFSLNFNPSYGYYKMRWNNFRSGENFLKTNYLNFSIGSRFKFLRLTSGAEFGFSRFTEIYHILDENYYNENYSAANRSIFNTSLFLGFHIYNQSFIYLKGTYYLDDLFVGNGFDNDGNLVGPIFQRPIIFSGGIRINLRVKD